MSTLREKLAAQLARDPERPEAQLATRFVGLRLLVWELGGGTYAREMALINRLEQRADGFLCVRKLRPWERRLDPANVWCLRRPVDWPPKLVRGAYGFGAAAEARLALSLPSACSGLITKRVQPIVRTPAQRADG